MQQKIEPRWINAGKDSSRIHHAIKGKPVKKRKKKSTDEPQMETPEKEKKSTDATQTDTSGNALTVTAPTVETVGSDSEDSQSVEENDKLNDNDEATDSDEDTPCADYNNPTKSTSQNY